MGMGLLTASQGLEMVASVLARTTNETTAVPVMTCNPFSWGRLLQQLPKDDVPTLFEEFAEEECVAPRIPRHGLPTARGRVGRSGGLVGTGGTNPSIGSNALTRQELQSHVLAAINKVLGGEIGLDAPLMDAGGGCAFVLVLRMLYSNKQSGIEIQVLFNIKLNKFLMDNKLKNYTTE
jgi:hypothetical protein